MKKVFLDTLRYPFGGGVKRYIKNLVKGLSKYETDDIEIFKIPNAPKLFSPQNKLIIPFRDNFILPLFFKKRENIAHFPRAPGPLIKMGDCKKIITFHDFSSQILGINPSLERLHKKIATRKAIESSDHIICVSKSTKSDLIELYGPKRDKISVVYPGLEKKFLNSDNQLPKKQNGKDSFPKYILSVGTLSPRKNYVRLIKAFETLANNKKDIHLVIAGKKGWRYKPILKKSANSHHREKIHLLGYVKENELLYLYKNASLFVLPSIYEGFGFPPLEAMACGTPVITSNTSSLPEVVGNAGIKVDPYDTERLAEEMRRVLESDGLKKKMIKKGLKRAKKFSWKKTAKKTIEVYKEVLDA